MFNIYPTDTICQNSLATNSENSSRFVIPSVVIRNEIMSRYLNVNKMQHNEDLLELVK